MLQVIHAAVRKFVAEIKAGGPPSTSGAGSCGDGAANGASAAAAAEVKARYTACAAFPPLWDVTQLCSRSHNLWFGF